MVTIGAGLVIVGILLFIIGAFLQQFEGPSDAALLFHNPNNSVPDYILGVGIFMIIIGGL
jgi:hypothetical protein